MNCHYCNAKCKRTTGLPTSPTNGIILYECVSCGAFFRFLSNGDLFYITWNVYLEDRCYFIKIYNGVTGNAPEFVIYYQTKNEEGHNYWEQVVRWDFIPESWTPQNVEHKLKLYLPFL